MIPQKSMDEIVGRAAGNRTRSTCTPCMCTAGILQPVFVTPKRDFDVAKPVEKRGGEIR